MEALRWDLLAERAALAVAVLALTAIVGLALAAGLRRIGRSQTVRKYRIYRLLAGSVNTVAAVVGVICALGTLGVNVSALVAGLGLTGLALGLALKDTVAGFVSGLMIILYSPFELDDELEVAGVRGRVVDMDLRYVSIRARGELILIPNSTFLNSIVRIARPSADDGADPPTQAG